MNKKSVLKTIILSLPLLILSFSGNAQFYRPHPLLSPMWQIEGEYLAPSQVKDTTLKNGFAGGGISFRIPLYLGKDWLSADGGKPFYAIISQFGANARHTQLDYLQPDRNLTLAKAGIIALMATGPSSLRNLYMLHLTASLPTEEFWFKSSYLHFHGALIWRRLYHNNKFWHTLGIVYSPINGRDLILPVIGGGLKLGNDDQLQLTFPFNFAYTHAFSKKFSMTAKLNANGSYYYIKQDSVHFDNPLIYRQRFPKVSIMARYYTDRFVVLTPEIGLAGKGTIFIGEQKDKQAVSPYFKLTLQVRFGKRPAASPILNFDPGDSGFDPSYLTE